MARVELSLGKNAEAEKLGQDIINAQEKDITMIDAWMNKGS